ncbi:DUF723 domain-containing protein [Vibrio sp. SCSIO 43140]|uniref:DUF723 domain-containing protein n=1 Tax=Vibrio sp. SCSIO 43140 TaxID=2819100 RepID=UPI002186809C|nr:DUF723 domain-containing protein [Vibrio sp. SCSIO 43140]
MTERSTNGLFKVKGILKHGPKFYDYSKVDYKTAHKKVMLICPIHGEFEQTATNHLSGNGCPECKADKLSELYTRTPSKTKNVFSKHAVQLNTFFK